jgi:hypothetical protein
MVMCEMRILQVLYAMPFVFGMLYEALYTERLWNDAATKLPRGFLLPSTGNLSTLFKNKLWACEPLHAISSLECTLPKVFSVYSFYYFCLKRIGKCFWQ